MAEMFGFLAAAGTSVTVLYGVGLLAAALANWDLPRMLRRKP